MATNSDTRIYVGTWDHVDDENFDALLKKLGFGMIKRWIAKEIHPRLIISENGGIWTIRAETTLKTKTITFTPGVEFDDTTLDGRDAKSIARFENGQWFQKFTEKNGSEMTTVRYVDDQGLHEEITYDSIKARRRFKRIE